MNHSMICISTDSILAAEPDVRQAILELAGLAEIKARAPTGFGVLSTRSSPLELDEGEAEQFLQNCSPKTKKVLTEIVGQGGKFNYQKLEKRLSMGSLRGVWTGITNRTRKLSGKADSNLIEWVWNDERDSYDGIMAPKTVEAFRKLL